MDAPSTKICVIAGLGNPGKKYQLTRHNLGYLVVQEFAALHGWSFKDETEFSAKVAKGTILDDKIHLLLPMTYMNESGRSIKRYLDFYKFTPDQLLIVSDDIALPFKEIRLRLMGSSGGHNGLKSIEAHLGTKNYARLRMGIGSELNNKDLADFVLENFNTEELSELAKFVQRGTAVLEEVVKCPVEQGISHIKLANG